MISPSTATIVCVSGAKTNSEIVKLPKKLLPIFEINAVLNGEPVSDYEYLCILDKSTDEIDSAIDRGELPVVLLSSDAEHENVLRFTYVAKDSRAGHIFYSSNLDAFFWLQATNEYEAHVYMLPIDKEFILQSTTPNSTKKFKIAVDDSGALSAVEVTE